MSGLDENAKVERYEAAVGLGVISLAGVLFAVVEFQHVREMSSTLGITVFALLPLIAAVGLIGAALHLWRSRFEGGEILRIAGWVVLWMGIIGLLATWTITHQNIRGRAFAHAPFVTVNNVSAGGLIGFAFGWYDADRRRYQRQVETERARLEFLHSSLRHNVLNGMNVILGNVDLLEANTDVEAQDHLDVIQRRAEELTRYTEATNALLENYLGRSGDSARQMDLSTVLSEEIERFRTEFPDAEFVLECPENLYFEGDDLVSELFGNLVSNAVVHNDKPTPRVQVSVERSNGRALVRVADNGPGIPANERDRMLEWNERSADSPGSGLGLPIADTVANRYGGELWLESNDPEGTVACVELSVHEESAVEESANNPSAEERG